MVSNIEICSVGTYRLSRYALVIASLHAARQIRQSLSRLILFRLGMSVLLNDAVNCQDYTASVIDEWIWRTCGMTMTEENRSTLRLPWDELCGHAITDVPFDYRRLLAVTGDTWEPNTSLYNSETKLYIRNTRYATSNGSKSFTGKQHHCII
jgi:hypothetical protein